jgi:hypothetical protein
MMKSCLPEIISRNGHDHKSFWSKNQKSKELALGADGFTSATDLVNQILELILSDQATQSSQILRPVFNDLLDRRRARCPGNLTPFSSIGRLSPKIEAIIIFCW